MTFLSKSLSVLSALALTTISWGSPMQSGPAAPADTATTLFSLEARDQGQGIPIDFSSYTSRVQERAANATPFKGALMASEGVEGSLHQLTGKGIGTLFGRFTYSATITVNDDTGDGDGSAVWSAANGDSMNTTLHGGLAGFEYPIAIIWELQVVTGGTGRFANARGSISVSRTLNIETGETMGTFVGTITLAH
jgi:hypothetical protein